MGCIAAGRTPRVDVEIPPINPAYFIKGGRYVMNNELLGKGGFATVHSGYYLTASGSREALAIKVVRCDSSSNKTTMFASLMLKQEAIILLGIRHKNIVTALDFVEEQHDRYLIMECIPGNDLFNTLNKKQSYFEYETKDWALQLLHAIEYLHDRNIVHRDLKLDNIMVTKDGTLKLIDFGFAIAVHPGKMLYSFVGTIGYEPPEVVSHQPYDGKVCDMWSFGVILCILLEGKHPFDSGEDEATVNRRIVENKWAFTSTITGSLSPASKNLVSKLLVVSPGDRLSATGALGENWFTNLDICDGNSNINSSTQQTCNTDLQEVLARLRHYHAVVKMRAAVHAISAFQRHGMRSGSSIMAKDPLSEPIDQLVSVEVEENIRHFPI